MLILWLCFFDSYVSPRRRAQRTLELLNIGCRERLPWQDQQSYPDELDIRTNAKVQIVDAIREWDYGDYEGLTSAQIREQRKEKFGGDGSWDIWKDGCPGGEYDVPSNLLFGSGLETFTYVWT